MLARLHVIFARIRATVAITLPRAVRDGVSIAFESFGKTLFTFSRRRRARLRHRLLAGPRPGGQWFSADEAELVHCLATLIVPSQDDSPGAEDVETLGTSALQQIDGWVGGDPRRQALYRNGLLGLDDMAHDAHGVPFVRLAASQQRQLLRGVEVRERKRSDPGVVSKVAHKLRQLYGMWRGWGTAVELLPTVIGDVYKAFYTSEVSWLWLGYDGPPMPLGYESLTSPRPRRIVSPPAVVRSRPAPPGPRAETADVVIVGCGAGGAVVAKELAEAGLSVVVLEAGRRYEPSLDYTTDRSDFELRASSVFDPMDERRDMYTTRGGKAFSYNRVKGVGGSTLHYAAMSPRLHESDFHTRSLDGVGEDWPLTYADLEPYYTRVEYQLGVSGPDGANPFEPPRSRPYPTPPHGFNLASQAIKRGADLLGLHMVREPLALPSRDWQGRPACVGAGTCHMGCLISAKSSMDVTYVRKAEATRRVDIRTNCMAREVEIDRSGKARGVVYFDPAGHEQRIAARAVVLACNAVETARLLLMSQSNHWPQGLANSSGLVGRNFMEHLAVFTFGRFDQRVDSWRGTPTGGMLQDYYETESKRGFARGWTTLVTANSHWPFAVARRLGGWGEEHKQSMLQRFGYSACIATIGEQLPDLRNHVALDPVKRDVYGLPVPLLENLPRANDQAMIHAMQRTLKELLESAGAVEIWGNEYGPGMSSHYLGTCRMGHDPRRSVVDKWCRSHDVPNLFIADGSVLVTVGAVNPALTISALAVRTAEGIVAAFKRRDL